MGTLGPNVSWPKPQTLATRYEHNKESGLGDGAHRQLLGTERGDESQVFSVFRG